MEMKDSHTFSKISIKQYTSDQQSKPELSMKKLRLELHGLVLWAIILDETQFIQHGCQLFTPLIGLFTPVSHS